MLMAFKRPESSVIGVCESQITFYTIFSSKNICLSAQNLRSISWVSQNVRIFENKSENGLKIGQMAGGTAANDTSYGLLDPLKRLFVKNPSHTV